MAGQRTLDQTPKARIIIDVEKADRLSLVHSVSGT
jgi:hypothetical protein